MALMRLNGMAAIEKRKQMLLIDWSPQMRLWPGDDFPVLDTMDFMGGIEGGEVGDLEDLKSTQRYIIRLIIEEDANIETDRRVDN